MDWRSSSSSTPSAGFAEEGRSATRADRRPPTRPGMFGTSSVPTSTLRFQFSPLSRMNANKGASASNLGIWTSFVYRATTGSDESGLSATVCDSAPPARRCKSVDRLWEQSMSREDNGPKDALASSEQELRLLVETIPTLVWRAAPDGNFEYVNKRMLEYLGAPLAEVIGWEWMDKVHPDD